MHHKGAAGGQQVANLPHQVSLVVPAQQEGTVEEIGVHDDLRRLGVAGVRVRYNKVTGHIGACATGGGVQRGRKESSQQHT